MKNNTTSNDNGYTIQPLTTSIDIKTERNSSPAGIPAG